MTDEPLLPIYSRRLREARHALGISQRDLGARMRLDNAGASNRIERYESGLHEPDLQTLILLAEALDRPLAYFYTEDDALARLLVAFER